MLSKTRGLVTLPVYNRYQHCLSNGVLIRQTNWYLIIKRPYQVSEAVFVFVVIGFIHIGNSYDYRCYKMLQNFIEVKVI